jgi:hypothetical protein
MEKTTLGDISELAALKSQMEADEQKKINFGIVQIHENFINCIYGFRNNKKSKLYAG